jgi:hypothetical protein
VVAEERSDPALVVRARPPLLRVQAARDTERGTEVFGNRGGDRGTRLCQSERPSEMGGRVRKPRAGEALGGRNRPVNQISN